MKIYSYVRISIVTGEIIEEVSFDYDGPLALCGEDDGEDDGDDGGSDDFGQNDYGSGDMDNYGGSDDYGQNEYASGVGGYGTSLGADPAGLAGMFAGSPLADDFGVGFFSPGGTYEQNIGRSTGSLQGSPFGGKEPSLASMFSRIVPPAPPSIAPIQTPFAPNAPPAIEPISYSTTPTARLPGNQVTAPPAPSPLVPNAPPSIAPIQTPFAPNAPPAISPVQSSLEKALGTMDSARKAEALQQIQEGIALGKSVDLILNRLGNEGLVQDPIALRGAINEFAVTAPVASQDPMGLGPTGVFSDPNLTQEDFDKMDAAVWGTPGQLGFDKSVAAAALAKGGILNPGAWAAGGIGGLISGSTLGTSGYDTGQYSSTDGGVDSGTGGDFGDTSGSGSEGGEGSPVNPAANVLDPNKTGETTPPTTTGGTEMGIKKESYLDVLAKMSQDYYNKTAPARENILQRGQNFLEGGLDVTQSPMWASGKNAAEVLYKRAQDDTRANLPSGGALQSSLAEGDTNKARTLTDLASQIGTDEYNKIFSIAQGSPAVAMSGLGTAAGQQANMSGQASQLQAALAGIAATTAGQQMYKNVQEDAQKNQLYGDLGSGLGEGIGAGLEKG